MNGLALCAGVGGLELGLKLVFGDSYSCKVYCEREGYAAAVLVKAMEEGRLHPGLVWDDVKSFDGRPWRGIIQIVSGGFPCQPFSKAGKRLGTADPRHLWPDIARIISEVEPEWCFFENVANHLRMGYEQVHDDLCAMGYRVAAGLFSAEEVGASHQRERLFILAHSYRTGAGLRRPQPADEGGRGPDACGAAALPGRHPQERGADAASRDIRPESVAHALDAGRGRPRPDDGAHGPLAAQGRPGTGESGRYGLGRPEIICGQLVDTCGVRRDEGDRLDQGEPRLGCRRRGHDGATLAGPASGDFHLRRLREYDDVPAGNRVGIAGVSALPAHHVGDGELPLPERAGDEVAQQGFSPLADPLTERPQGEQSTRPAEQPAVGSCGVPLFPPGPRELGRWQSIEQQYPWLLPAIAGNEKAPEPLFHGMVDGTTARVDRIRACGNAVVPLAAAYALCTLRAALVTSPKQ